MTSGGVAAAFGFYYQHLLTLEIILDLYESVPGGFWRVGVDVVSQDSADILVYGGGSSVPDRAVQVKASMASSKTTMGRAAVLRCLASLSRDHPAVGELVVLTNRSLSASALPLAGTLDLGEVKELGLQPGQSVVLEPRRETLRELTDRLRIRVGRLRDRGSGGLGDALQHLVLVRLLDLVHECGSRSHDQFIDSAQVAVILDDPAAALADAIGERNWGRTYQVLSGSYVSRPAVSSFLTAHLTREDLISGTPTVVALSGISGAGKSVAAATWAETHREGYAFTLWLDASSEDVLASQLPGVFTWLGQELRVDVNASQALGDLLASLPFPWLLVLDGAMNYEALREWVPKSGYGHVITTTYHSDWPIDVAPLCELDPMGEEEAKDMIRARLAGAVDDPSGNMDHAAVTLAERMGGWPLAIDLACAWVRRLGGDYTNLTDFVDRVDRIDLGDESIRPGNYPHTAVAVTQSLWESLSAESQAVFVLVFASGGSHVPVALLTDWARSLPAEARIVVDMPSVLAELHGSSLVRVRLRTDLGLSASMDEMLYMHDGVRVVFEHVGVGAPEGFIFRWLEVCTSEIVQLIDQTKFVEASALLPAAEGLLHSLVRRDMNPEMLRFATLLMHNVGTVARLIGLFDLAKKWFTVAVNIRRSVAQEELRENAKMAVLQMQTISALVQILVKQRSQEELQVAIELGLDIARPHLSKLLDEETPTVRESLIVFRQALTYTAEDNSELEKWIDEMMAGQLYPTASTTQLDRIIFSFQEEVERAEQYVHAEQWTLATDTVLAIANHTLRVGILMHEATEAVLDLSVSMLSSMLIRGHKLPPDSWAEAVQRLVGWSRDSDLSLDQSQADRFSILRPIVALDFEGLVDVLEELQQRPSLSEQLASWISIGKIVVEMLRKEERFRSQCEGLGALPFMTIVRTFDGGDDVNWWSVTLEGKPAVVFSTSSVRMIEGGIEKDPVLGLMVRAGFPAKLGADGVPPEVDRWSIKINGSVLALRDASGNAWLTADLNEDLFQSGWVHAVLASKRIRVVYGDPADLSAKQVMSIPSQGYVRVNRGHRFPRLFRNR